MKTFRFIHSLTEDVATILAFNEQQAREILLQEYSGKASDYYLDSYTEQEYANISDIS